MREGSTPEATPAGPALFSFAHVGVLRDDRWILRDVTATVPPGAVTALVGHSGAGKTTLLRLCNRLEVPDTGTVAYHGRELSGSGVPAHRREVGMVFQQPALFGGTVRDNLLQALPDASEPQLRAAVAEVALPGTALDAPASRLSGGEAQRVCLARTLITRPAVLLLDEPTSALDADNRLAFEQLILGLVGGTAADGRAGVPAVWVTHDLHQVHRVADHVLVLDSGRVVHAGRPQDLPPPGARRDPSGARPPAAGTGPPGDVPGRGGAEGPPG